MKPSSRYLGEGNILVSKFILIFDLLSDEKWHGVDEFLVRAKLTEKTSREVAEFLDKYGFIEFSRKDQKVKIDKDFKKLLVQENIS